MKTKPGQTQVAKLTSTVESSEDVFDFLQMFGVDPSGLAAFVESPEPFMSEAHYHGSTGPDKHGLSMPRAHESWCQTCDEDRKASVTSAPEWFATKFKLAELTVRRFAFW